MRFVMTNAAFQRLLSWRAFIAALGEQAAEGDRARRSSPRHGRRGHPRHRTRLPAEGQPERPQKTRSARAKHRRRAAPQLVLVKRIFGAAYEVCEEDKEAARAGMQPTPRATYYVEGIFRTARSRALQEMDWRWVDESNLFEVLDPDGELDLPAQRAAVERLEEQRELARDQQRALGRDRAAQVVPPEVEHAQAAARGRRVGSGRANDLGLEPGVAAEKAVDRGGVRTLAVALGRDDEDAAVTSFGEVECRDEPRRHRTRR